MPGWLARRRRLLRFVVETAALKPATNDRCHLDKAKCRLSASFQVILSRSLSFFKLLHAQFCPAPFRCVAPVHRSELSNQRNLRTYATFLSRAERFCPMTEATWFFLGVAGLALWSAVVAVSEIKTARERKRSRQ